MKHIVIIGNGISGVTAARFLRKLSNHRITIISSETQYFFSRTALMYVYMGHMKREQLQPYEPWFWKKNRIELLEDRALSIDYNNKSIALQKGQDLSYDQLILATGSTPNKFGWPGQDLDGVRGLYSMQDLDYVEQYSKDTQRAVIVGGGLIGIELAEMFHSRGIATTFLVREKSYWDLVLPPEESQMVNREIRDNHIDLRLETELEEILSDKQGRVRGIRTKDGEEIPCQFVGLTAGVHPNINFLRSSGLEIDRGILVNDYLQTSIPDVYAIGDCAQLRKAQTGRRPIEAVWYTGRMMGQQVAQNIVHHLENKALVAYRPRLWFNSAKFIDIEYQVYGTVLAKAPENHSQLYWEAADGKKSIRLVYDRDSKAILGFNLMGIRYRHEVCEKWILEQSHIEQVLQNLGLANFDPEFYTQYEQDLVDLYNQQTNSQVQLKQKRSLTAALKFLKNKLYK